jgi:hypothetical protein
MGHQCQEFPSERSSRSESGSKHLDGTGEQLDRTHVAKYKRLRQTTAARSARPRLQGAGLDTCPWETRCKSSLWMR